MKDWIEKNIDPPGIEKKNKGSLFSVIGKVFAKVRDDAEKAFKAHFPYLSDLPTLRKHGKSLSIPEFPNDREDEFRERVSAASFFLARAGERSYIHQQLKMHFGNQYSLSEKFLEVTINILDVTEKDFMWLWTFFDEVFDPNIKFIIGEWFDFLEEMLVYDNQHLIICNEERDTVNQVILRNGRVLRDGKTVFDTQLDYLFRNGKAKRDGSVTKRDGTYRVPAVGVISPPFYRRSGPQDNLSMVLKDNNYIDETFSFLFRNSAVTRNGTAKRNGKAPYSINESIIIDKLELWLSDTGTVTDSQDVTVRVDIVDGIGRNYKRNGTNYRNGSIYRSSDRIVDLFSSFGTSTPEIDSLDINETTLLGLKYHYFHDGTLTRNGSKQRKGMIFIPLE